jgi:LysM repeat protein
MQPRVLDWRTLKVCEPKRSRFTLRFAIFAAFAVVVTSTLSAAFLPVTTAAFVFVTLVTAYLISVGLLLLSLVLAVRRFMNIADPARRGSAQGDDGSRGANFRPSLAEKVETGMTTVRGSLSLATSRTEVSSAGFVAKAMSSLRGGLASVSKAAVSCVARPGKRIVSFALGVSAVRRRVLPMLGGASGRMRKAWKRVAAVTATIGLLSLLVVAAWPSGEGASEAPSPPQADVVPPPRIVQVSLTADAAETAAGDAPSVFPSGVAEVWALVRVENPGAGSELKAIWTFLGTGSEAAPMIVQESLVPVADASAASLVRTSIEGPLAAGTYQLDLRLNGGETTLKRFTVEGLASIPPTVVATPTVEPEPSRPTTYVVKYGDTLNNLASAWGVSVADIAALNGISNVNLIRTGQVLKVPEPSH